MIDKQKLKNSWGGPLGAENLFKDLGMPNENAPYSVDELYHFYMDCEDLTEWDFANTYLLGWEHWEKLQDNKKFAKILQAWRRDLEQKIKSKAFKEIKLIAEEGGKNSFEANKLLLNGKWKEIVEKAANPRGRPSKAEIDQKAQEELDSRKVIEEDLKRLGLLQ